jgi:formate hydrogenlyase transcriptional activator
MMSSYALRLAAPDEDPPKYRSLTHYFVVSSAPGDAMTNADSRAGTGLDQDERVETLLIELSSRFISLAPGHLYLEIRETQRRICDFLGFDRSSLFEQPADDPAAFLLTHVYQRPGMPPRPTGKPDVAPLFPWTVMQLKQGRTVKFSKLDDLPAEAACDREAFLQYGTHSLVVVPLAIESRVIGALTFASAQERGEWPARIVKWLQLVAEVIANGIARARSETELRESEAVNRATFEQAAAGIAHVGTDGRWLRVNDRLCTIVGYPREELLQLTSQDITHPDDLQTDLDYVRQVLSGEIKTYSMEKRYFRKDRSLVWVDLAVSLVRTAAGEPKHFISVVADITDRKRAEEQLRRTLEEVQRLRDQLQEQNVYLQQEVKLLHGHNRIIGQSQALKRVLSQVEQVAPTGSTVLLLGETGTGKGLIASAIHELSPRRGHPMVRVNCSAIPTSLIENELFGREKGAYTGALSRQIGRFEVADGSTLFLDEIGDLPPDVQVKLLRVLEEKQIERLGSPRSIPVDVRIVAATHRDLEEAVREGRFRQDLYYRLNVFPITVPPLRERREDIPALVSALVSEFGTALGKTIESVARASMEALQRYSWPGNVRELRNVIERAMIVARGPKLWVEPPGKAGAGLTPQLTLEEVEREHIQRVLEATGWRVRGKNGAAEMLGFKPTTLESRMAKLGIRRRVEACTK